MTSTETPTRTTPADLADAKTGDMVMMWGSYESRPVKVGHTTPTRITCQGRTFHRKDGREVGNRHGAQVRPVRPGELEARDHAAAANSLIGQIAHLVNDRGNAHRLVAGPIANLEAALAALQSSINAEEA